MQKKTVLNDDFETLLGQSRELIDQNIRQMLDYKPETLSHSVALYHLTCAIRMLDELSTLCSRNFNSEARHKLAELLRLYISFKWLYSLNRMQKISGFVISENITDPSEYGLEGHNPGWSGKPLAQMAEETGLFEEYKALIEDRCSGIAQSTDSSDASAGEACSTLSHALRFFHGLSAIISEAADFQQNH
ncbi:MAG: hypothetical protein PHQ23_08550 [Candidatus Wallbacteria bacterium]|nr:hypothetical protein [Candidatus Wallbacteria bacterium]